MKIFRFTSFLILSLLSSNLWAQIPIERKIIIDNNTSYLMSRDEFSGMITKYVGAIDRPIAKAQKYILPWSRHDDSPPHQFLWDVYKDTLYCINTMKNSQNIYSDNIKKNCSHRTCFYFFPNRR